MGVILDDLMVLRVDYIWLSAEVAAEQFCSTVLAFHYAKGKPLADAIQELRSERSTMLDMSEVHYPPGATDEDKEIFHDRFIDHLKERIEEFEEIEADYVSHAHQQPKEVDVADRMAARPRRLGFVPD